MRKHVLMLFLFIAGISALSLPGCEKEKEADLTDWSTPHLEEKYETIKGAGTEKAAEPVYTEPEPVTYIVRKGDTLSGIADKYDISPGQLAEANGLTLKGPKSVIYPGQELIIPLD